MVKYLSKIVFNVNGKITAWHILVYDWQGFITHFLKINNWLVGYIFLVCRAKKLRSQFVSVSKEWGPRMASINWNRPLTMYPIFHARQIMMCQLSWPRVSFHIDKTNNYIFQKINPFFNFEIIYFFIIYYDIVIWVVKLFRM